MDSDLWILISVNIANLLLGVGVLVRNPRLLVNQVFAFLSFSIIFWATMNFLADHSNELFTPLFTRLTLVGGILIVLSVVFLTRNFPNGKALEKSVVNNAQPWVALIMTALTLTPLVVEAAIPGANGAELTNGPLYFLYIIYILQAVVLFVFNLITQAKATKIGHQRNQIAIVLTGLLLYALFAILSNVILPLFMNNWTSSRYGPIFSLVLVVSIAYAIVRHRLFDIRWALARSLSYVGAFVLFVLLYGVLVFGVVTLVFQLELPFFLQVVITATTGVAAVSFQSFRRTFDRLTNKVFYKDGFDSQEFFNVFNKSVAMSTELDTVLRNASTTIVRFLKVEYSLVDVAGRENGIAFEGKRQPKFSANVQERIISAIEEIKRPVILADELLPEQERLRQFLYKNQIAAIVQLHTGEAESESENYIVLGPKRNGGAYNKRDISVLESAANELSLALQNTLRFEEIRNFNQTLQERIDEATKELRATNRQLQQLDEAKDEFISMASHQLRTPLTSVKGYISMVLEEDAGKVAQPQRQLLTEAFASSERMVRLINDFLNVSRLQTGKFMLEKRTSDLSKIVAQEIDSLQPTIQMHGLKVTYRKPSYFPLLTLDEAKIRQVIMNFIDNAIYYSKEGSTIKVSVAVEEGQAVLRVKDTGIGVPKDEQSHLFSKFFRATNARKQRPDGTGVGLFLAKKVIDAHHGTILFESVEGKGSTFGFRLPIKRLSPKEAKGSNKLKHEPHH